MPLRLPVARDASTYARLGHRTVNGWLTPLAIRLICEASRMLDDDGVTGSTGEIGVHHGRLFILLDLLNREASTDGDRVSPSVAWDLFERQDENTDRSGRGDRDIFLKNVRAWAADSDRVRAVTANSMDLTAEDIAASLEVPARMFSIDGGHWADNTLHDLEIATPNLDPRGVLILDDFFNPRWPGVADGTFQFMAKHPGDLVPVAIGGNKFLFTRSAEHAARLRDGLAESGRIGSVARQELFGHEVLTFTETRMLTFRTAVRKHPLWVKSENTKLGRLARKITAQV